MTIRSKPASEEYIKNFEKTFGERKWTHAAPTPPPPKGKMLTVVDRKKKNGKAHLPTLKQVVKEAVKEETSKK